jgi:TetR/AcrR family transcriptional repressor of nem operon
MSAITRTDTRDRLLTVAANLMWERGYQATGVDELCKLAKAKKGSFYHFFASKTDLAIAAVESSWIATRNNIFVPIFSDSSGGLDQLDALVAKVSVVTFSDDLGAVLGCPFGSLAQEMARHDQRIRETLQQIFDEHCTFIEAALDRAQQKKEIPVGDNQQRAKAIFAALQGALLLAKVENDPDIIRKILPAIRATAAAEFG